jgi:hypothetical protein
VQERSIPGVVSQCRELRIAPDCEQAFNFDQTEMARKVVNCRRLQ